MLLYSGTITVEYSMFDITANATPADIEQAQRDRGDGMLGRSSESGATVFTASQDGDLPLEVHLWEREPDPTPEWDRHAERVLLFPESRFALTSFDSEFHLGLPHEGRYNLRCSVRGYDDAVMFESGPSDVWFRDQYRLDLWPAEVSSDDPTDPPSAPTDESVTRGQPT